MGYKILTKDKRVRHCLWDANAETLIAMLAKRLGVIREYNMREVRTIVRELNFEYLRKRKNVKSSKNYSPTALQRSILNDEGY